MARTKGTFKVSPAQLIWLARNFGTMANRELAERLDMSMSTMSRYARLMGLRKDPEWEAQMRKDVGKEVLEIKRRNGTLPPKGVFPEGLQRKHYCFESGKSNLERWGAEKDAARIAKSAASREHTRALERTRHAAGLPQLTKFKVTREPRRKHAVRYRLKVLGYRLDEAAHLAYWNAETKRSKRYEQMDIRKVYYRFAEDKAI